jgi:hypothetical protein
VLVIELQREVQIGDVQDSLDVKQNPISKMKNTERDGRVAQVV